MIEENNDIEMQRGISIWQSIKIFLIILLFQVIAGLVVGIIASLIQVVFYLIKGSNLNISLGYTLVISEVLGYITAFKFIQRNNKFEFRIKNKMRGKETIICLVILLGTILTADNSINFIIQKLVSDSWVNKIFSDMGKTPFVALIMLMLIAPFFEEFFMRGIILEQLLRRYRPSIAITISALLFAILHMNITQGVNAFLLGIAFGVVYTKTRNLALCFIMHGANNLLSILGGFFPLIFNTNFSMERLIIGVILLSGSLYIFKHMNNPI